ncbi:hypothetical protein [Paenibacillus campinasensis]|uniref:Uncharacterized protein n=1 Tax=Paenibacillus campinasensis TaxID=66347 RepID=A0A268EH84_9BACL|nr:hypothetical protein [Paenibacillus campinasensis]PAD72434.1 hypothetical protein CHH67_22600 [Paenibacillus campinasensis]
MEKFKAIAKEIFENKYQHVGIRLLCEDENYNVGDDCRESYEHDFENDVSSYYTTGETADGTCATRVDTFDFNFFFYDDEDIKALASKINQAVDQNKVYGSGKRVIIAGTSSYTDGHFDEDEIRIRNAQVIALLD